MKENDSKNARMTNEQAQAQRECDVLAYHQSENLQSDTRVCVKFGTSGLQWVKAGDELRDAIKWLNEDNDKGCLVSISEFKGERFNENSVELMKIFYVKLYATKKFRPSTKEEGRQIILEYCSANAIPEPSVIVHDGNQYILKWILIDPLEGKYFEVWKQIQRYLAERFFKLLDGGYYLDDEYSPKRKFIEAHTNATAMLRVPGFLNNRTVELNLFTHFEETCLIFSSGQRYGASEMAVRLYLSKWEIEQYRNVKECCGGYSHKKSSPSSFCDKISLHETDRKEAELLTSMDYITGTALKAHHDVREGETFIYVRRKNTNKHSRTDRTYYYDSYSTAELEKFLRRSDIDRCDFWATAAEYHFGFSKLKEKTVIRQRDGKTYEETRRQLPKREKWIDAIQLNPIIVNFRNSELGYIPTVEEAKELIYARCLEHGLPKPVIVDTGDGETYELLWIWRNVMTNCGERDNPRIKYPKFNPKFDSMQEAFFRLLWDFGADEKKLSPTVMLSVVGTPNTKTGRIRSIVGEADEILTYEELASLLGFNFGEVSEKKTRETLQPKHDKIQERNPIEAAETMSRASEVIEPESPFVNVLAELAKYTDFEFLMTKKNSQDQQISATHETREPQTEEKEIPAPETEVTQPVAKVPNDINIALDLWRLHHGSDNWVCICTQNKAKGKWNEHWTLSSGELSKG